MPQSFVDMLLEGQLILVPIAVQVDLLRDASLLPKSGDGASYLHMAETVPLDHQKLLSLAEISHIALAVHSAGVEPCPAFRPASPGY